MPKKKNSIIDVAKTRQHPNRCGEEVDLQLAFLLSINAKKQKAKPTPEDGSDSDDGTVDLVVGAKEVVKDANSEDQNLSTIDEENVEIIDEGHSESQ